MPKLVEQMSDEDILNYARNVGPNIIDDVREFIRDRVNEQIDCEMVEDDDGNQTLEDMELTEEIRSRIADDVVYDIFNYLAWCVVKS